MTAFGGELGEAKERLIYYKWTHTHTQSLAIVQSRV